MRTKIKEIVATGGNLGMRGDFLFFWWGVSFYLVAGLFCSC